MIKRGLLILIVIMSLGKPAFNADAIQLPHTLKYKLDLRIDYNNDKLYGNCEITISNGTNQPLEKVPILMYRLLTVKSVEDEMSMPLHFTQNVVSVTGWEKLQVNFIVISLNKSLSPGEKRTIKLAYEGYLLGYVEEGWRYVKDHINKSFTIIRTDGFDYPVLGYPNDQDMLAVGRERYDYEIKITVPKNIKAACGGEFIDQIETENETTFIFQSKKPSWRLDIALSDYQILEENKNKICYFKHDSVGSRSILTALEKTLELYSGWFGPLENYSGYTVIEVPEGYSSQADVSSFNITADNFKEPEEMLTIYHEISHLWNVKDLDPQPCRLNSEGLAMFLEFLLSEILENKENAVSKAAQEYLDDIRKDFQEKPEYQKVPIKDYGIKDMTEYSYTLGMVFFAVLYDLIGQDNFIKTIRSYYSTYHSSDASLDEFINCFKKSSAPGIERFINDWVYSTNAIKLVVEGKTFQELIDYYTAK